MIIRKTISTKKKKIYRGKFEIDKTRALFKVVTYWVLFIPVYQYDELIE